MSAAPDHLETLYSPVRLARKVVEVEKEHGWTWRYD